MPYDKFRQEATYEIPEVQPSEGLYKQAFATAMQQDFQRKENEKDRVEAEKKRLLALKGTEASSPYEIDSRKIGELANEQFNSKMNGDEPAHGKYGLQMRDIQNITISQNKREQAQIKDIDNKTAQGFIPKQTYFTEYRNKVANAGFDKRDVVQDEHDNIIATKPHEVYSTDDTWRGSVLTDKNFPITPYKQNMSVVKGSTTYNTDISTNSRFFIPTTEVEKDAQGNPIMVGGQPVYKPKPVATIEEARALVPDLIGSKIPKDYVALEASEVYSDPKKKQEIDEKVKEYENTVDPTTGKPDANSVSIFKEGLKEKYAQEKIAERILNEQKAYQRLASIGVSEKTEKPTEKEKEESKTKSNLRKRGGSGTNVDGVFVIPSKNIKTEYNSQKGGLSDINRVNSLIFQKEKNGNFTDVDAQTFSISGDITDETTGQKFKIPENEPALAKNIYPTLEVYNKNNNSWKRIVFDSKHGDKDFEAEIKKYGEKGTPIKVTMQGDINISTKQNKTGTIKPEESQELATLKNTKDRSEVQNARLGELEGKLSQEQGRTIRVNMEDSGILQQVTGYGNMQEMAKSAKSPEVRKIAENNVKWQSLAESYNNKKGYDVVELNKKSEEYKKANEESSLKIKEFNRIKEKQGTNEALKYAREQGAVFKDGKWEFNKMKQSEKATQSIKTAQPATKTKETKTTVKFKGVPVGGF